MPENPFEALNNLMRMIQNGSEQRSPAPGAGPAGERPRDPLMDIMMDLLRRPPPGEEEAEGSDQSGSGSESDSESEEVLNRLRAGLSVPLALDQEDFLSDADEEDDDEDDGQEEDQAQ